MFRENTVDKIEEKRSFALNLASRTHEGGQATAEQVLETAGKYLAFLNNFTVEDALAVSASRAQFRGALRDQVNIDAALAEELENARTSLNAAKKAKTQEEADELLKAAEFSYTQVVQAKAEMVAELHGADPRTFTNEVQG